MEVSAYNLKKVPRTIKRMYPHLNERSSPDGIVPIFLSTIEGNILFVIDSHNKECKSSSIDTALRIACYKVFSHIEALDYDTSVHENEVINDFVHAILYAFDPFTNETLMGMLKDSPDLFAKDDREVLKKYYESGFDAILRILFSLEVRDDMYGYNGYVKFLDREFRGNLSAEKLNYVTMIASSSLSEEERAELLN